MFFFAFTCFNIFLMLSHHFIVYSSWVSIINLPLRVLSILINCMCNEEENYQVLLQNHQELYDFIIRLESLVALNFWLKQKREIINGGDIKGNISLLRCCQISSAEIINFTDTEKKKQKIIFSNSPFWSCVCINKNFFTVPSLQRTEHKKKQWNDFFNCEITFNFLLYFYALQMNECTNFSSEFKHGEKGK